jgi:uncharacterized protein (TIGR01370 family)
MRFFFRRLMVMTIWSCNLWIYTSAAAFAAQPNIALFYGANPPWDELHAFDVVVVEPEHVPDPAAHATGKTALFAYVSLGETSPERTYLKDVPEGWKLGQNSEWGSVVLDQAQPAWPAFVAERVIKPLWDAGYRGFFLDTLDSYQKFSNTDADRKRQQTGLVAVMREIKHRYPDARLILNRGFELLPQVHADIFAVAAESLFQGWNQSRKGYNEVPPGDREWLLGQLKRVVQEYGLPVLAIDYVAPSNRSLARETASKIQDLGFIPWVTDGALDLLGVGAIEVMPRKVLMIHDSANTEYELEKTNSLLYGTLPLNHLGYVVEYLNSRSSLPAYQLAGRCAGIVVWLEKPAGKEGRALAAWLKVQMDAGVPVVILGESEFLLANSNARQLGLEYYRPVPQRTRLRIVQRDPLIGFEAQPALERQEFFPLRVTSGKPLLTLANSRGEKQDAVALTPWGGYALNPHVMIDLPSVHRGAGENQRWVINPIEFLQRALRLPDMPVPDVTTESGRRLLMVHMDGDGFANKAEFPGWPYAAELMYDRIFKKYHLPATVSVIQGELAADGLYPALSQDLEKIARKIFALPHVEVASHSLSHPFSWEQAKKTPNDPGSAKDGNRLAIPNYAFDLQREISGSISYIETRLAPPGKKVKTFLWTGDCNVGSDALALAEQSGVMSMNGGDTTITRSFPSLTLVSPLGVRKNGYFQVYAPNQNENVYTNDWLGPYYGYERVIETFELTDAPNRLKPIDIYFHTYSASKPASLKALEKVLQWAERQETTPIYASEYVRKVLDFNSMVVARTRYGWLVRGDGNLRELRAPLTAGEPDLDSSHMVAGFSRHGHSRYIHLADGDADIRFQQPTTTMPYLVSANGRIARLTRSEHGDGSGFSVELDGHVPLAFSLALAPRCTVNADGERLAPDSTNANGSNYFLRTRHVDQLRVYCPH